MNEEPTDRRKQTAVENGKLGGQPIGTERSDRTTYDPSELAQSAAKTILAGKPLINPNLGPLTTRDAASLKRALGEPVETFQARVSSALEEVFDETVTLIKQTLKEPIGSKTGFRPDTLPALMAITVDKHQAMSGRASAIGSVNIQINNFQGTDRPTVMSNLKGLRGDKPAQEPALTHYGKPAVISA